MRVGMLMAACVLCMTLTATSYAAEKEKIEYKQDTEIKQARGRKPAVVTLKRDDKGLYSWEIKGDETEDVIEADKRLRDYLKVKNPR